MSNSKSAFKKEYNLERRKQESLRILEKYPDRIPVIVEKAKNADLPDITKSKFLVPKDLTVGQFMYVVRKRMSVPAEKAIFMFFNDILPPTHETMGNMYNEYKDDDNFIYATIAGESTFGMGSDV